MLYYKFNEKDQALAYYIESLELAELYNNEEVLNAIYNNLGILYSENDLYADAENYFKRALTLSRQKNKPSRIAINLINIASIKEAMNKFDSALLCNDQALKILIDQDISIYQSTINNNIGNILYKEGKIKEANKKYSRAIILENEKPDQTNIGLYEFNIGKTFVLLSQYDSANVHLQKGLEFLKKANHSKRISEVYYWLYKNEKKVNNSKLEHSYILQSIAWKDTLINQIKNKWISDAQLKYEFGKIEKEIEYLEEKDKQQKRIIFAVVLISILFILFVLSVWKSRNRNLKQRNQILNKEKEIAKVEKERKEVERVKLAEEVESKLKLNKIKEEKIKLELEHKNKEVVSNTIHLMNKNEILNSLLILVEQIDLAEEDDNKKIIQEMYRSIKNNINQDKAWEDFKLHFDKVHESFNTSLNQKHPDLSPTDFRLCAYLLIGLNSKEIAHVSNISPESVRKRKQRLRQKLDLNSEIEVEEYLKSI